MEAQHLMDLGGGVGFFGTLLIGALAGVDRREGHPGASTV